VSSDATLLQSLKLSASIFHLAKEMLTPALLSEFEKACYHYKLGYEIQTYTMPLKYVALLHLENVVGQSNTKKVQSKTTRRGWSI